MFKSIIREVANLCQGLDNKIKYFLMFTGSQEVTSTLRLIIQLYHREGMHALFAGEVP